MNNFSKLKKSQEELGRLMQEFELVSLMDETQACEYMNAESKADALEAIQENIDFYKTQVEELESEYDEDAESDNGLDMAFSSWYQVNSMFV